MKDSIIRKLNMGIVMNFTLEEKQFLISQIEEFDQLKKDNQFMKSMLDEGIGWEDLRDDTRYDRY